MNTIVFGMNPKKGGSPIILITIIITDMDFGTLLWDKNNWFNKLTLRFSNILDKEKFIIVYSIK